MVLVPVAFVILTVAGLVLLVLVTCTLIVQSIQIALMEVIVPWEDRIMRTHVTKIL